MNAGKEKMRVLFLSDHLGYPGGIVHGATVYFLSVLPQLSSDDIDLTVCFLRNRHEAADRLERLGITPIFLSRHKWDPRALRDLVNIIRQRRIQIVHAAGMKGILLGRIAARMCGCRAVIHLHDTSVPGLLVGSMQRRLARWSDMAVVVSRAVGELAVGQFNIPRSRVRTMYNPVDIAQFAATTGDARSRIRLEHGIGLTTPTVGVISRLTSEKGHTSLIRAWPKVLSLCPAAKLLIAGEGDERPRCERLVDALGLRGSVTLLGNRRDVPDLLSAVDVVAVPSLREGLSYAALEAMAAGKPVVAFAVGGLPEIVDDGVTGLLAPAGDEDALARAIARVLKDNVLAQRFGRCAKRRARGFSVRRHVTELKVGYKHLLQRSLAVGDVASGHPQ